MSELKSGLILDEGEKLVMEIEAELWATSSNPFARALGAVYKFFAMICGTRRRGFIVLTNKRVVKVENEIACYCFNVSSTVKYLLPSSVKEVAYTRHASCGCFCPAFYLHFETFTECVDVMLKGADQAEAQKVVDAFYHAIASVQVGNA